MTAPRRAKPRDLFYFKARERARRYEMEIRLSIIREGRGVEGILSRPRAGD